MTYLRTIVLCGMFMALSASDLFAINWQHDFAKAQADAKRSGKPIMADFYTDWCGWCKKLDKETYADKQVNALAAGFICVKIDAEKNKGLTARFGVRGYPTIVFLNYEGEIDNVVAGYLPPPAFAKVMKDVLQKTKKSSAPEDTAAKPAEVSLSKLKLSGIIMDRNSPKAIINDAIVRVGDMVGGAKVVRITKQSVILMCDGRELALELEE